MNGTGYSRRSFIGIGASTAAYVSLAPCRAQTMDPTDLEISQASSLIRSGELSPVRLTEAYLERISDLDSRLNSYVTVTAASALERARQLEAEAVRGEWRGPLHGIPIALKDNIDTAGIRTTAASGVFQDRIPTEDAEVSRRLKEAGAVILGKLNMHEFALGTTSAVSHFGPVHNPWDIERIPGGSSGGSAAAVAARLCAGALGTDTAGSIRIPAAYCGIVGLKPTYGLTSIRGIIPVSASLDHVGPMTRSVVDTAIMLQALAGYDAQDNASIPSLPADYLDSLQSSVSTFRVGIPGSPFFDDMDPEVTKVTEKALELIDTMTAGRVEVELPQLSRATFLMSEAFRFHEELIDRKADLYEPSTLERILRGKNLSSAEYAEQMQNLEGSRDDIAATFADVDVLITPTVPRLPLPIESVLSAPAVAGSGRYRLRNTIPFNVYGVPALSLPCGFSSTGLPIGMQIVGPPLGEERVLALAQAYQSKTDWHRRKPDV